MTVVDAAVAFSKIVGEDDSLDDNTLGDEHPLGRQRAFNLLCWVYGSAPEDMGMKAAVKEAGLPASRIARCAEEYQSMHDAWLELLSPYLKQEAVPAAAGQ